MISLETIPIGDPNDIREQTFSAPGDCGMNTDQKTVRRDWRIPDELWACIQPLLPPRRSNATRSEKPLGCPRIVETTASTSGIYAGRTPERSVQ